MYCYNRSYTAKNLDLFGPKISSKNPYSIWKAFTFFETILTAFLRSHVSFFVQSSTGVFASCSAVRGVWCRTVNHPCPPRPQSSSSTIESTVTLLPALLRFPPPSTTTTAALLPQREPIPQRSPLNLSHPIPAACGWWSTLTCGQPGLVLINVAIQSRSTVSVCLGLFHGSLSTRQLIHTLLCCFSYASFYTCIN